jgi:hypothetical protein
VLDRDVCSSCASGHELADDLRVDARCEDDVRLQTPEPVGTRDPAEVDTGPHPDAAHPHALALESLEVWSPVTERRDARIEAQGPQLRQQQRKLALAAADAERREQEEDPRQPTASS